MEYKLDYKELHDFCKRLNSESEMWSDELRAIKNSLNSIVNTTNVVGAGSSSFKVYFSIVHIENLTKLEHLIEEHNKNVSIYEHDYLSKVSGDRKTHVETAEIKAIKKNLEKQRGVYERLHNEVESMMRNIQELINVSYPNETAINSARSKVSRLIDTLNNAICTVENDHVSKDFIYTKQLLESMKMLIMANLSKGRSFNNFNLAEYMISPEFQSLQQSDGMIVSDIQSKESLYIQARKSQESIESLYQKDLEERQNTAKAIKIGVLVAGVAIGIIASAVCPAASPLLIGAITGTLKGALTEGTDAALEAWVEDGEVDRYELAEIKRETIKGGIKGTVTGIISSGVSEGTKYITDNSSLSILSSENGLERVAAGGTIGSISDVVSGIVERGAEEIIDGVADKDFSWNKVAEKAFDTDKMKKDAKDGFISGGMNEYKRYSKEEEYRVKQDNGEARIGDEYLTRAEMKRNGWNPYMEDRYARLEKKNSGESILELLTKDRDDNIKDTYTILKTTASSIQIVLQP